MGLDTADKWRNGAAQEICLNGFYVNLGIGLLRWCQLTTIPEGMGCVVCRARNGLLVSAFPEDDKVDPDLINAGKQTVYSLPPAAAFFDQCLTPSP